MGRRSINTTKSGKFMNPTDQARTLLYNCNFFGVGFYRLADILRELHPLWSLVTSVFGHFGLF